VSRNALDVEGWRQATRASAASELKAQRLEREAALQRDQAETACCRAQRAWSEAEDASQAARQLWLQQVAQADRAAQAGVRGGQAIVEAFTYCERQSAQSKRAANDAAAAADAFTLHQEQTAQARQALVTRRVRLKATRVLLDQHRNHLLRAIDGLRDLDTEEDTALIDCRRRGP
jgi:hypothetical protein